ncbi:MAG: ABC transporter permease [Leptospirales bacterium]|nr:ABC transporter permease [Leptospirales bacterium]
MNEADLMRWLGNAAWIAGAATLLALICFAVRNPDGILRRILQQRGAGLAVALLSFYSLTAWIDQIRFTDSSQVFDFSLLDLAFRSMPPEAGYSAPLQTELAGASADLSEDRLLHSRHLLGTDSNGVDTLYLTLKGAGLAWKLILGSLAISAPLGLALGLISGYRGGWIDDLIQWLYNVVASVPWLLLTLAFLVVFGRSLFWLCVAFGLSGWVELARITRGETLRLRELAFVRAAHAAGASHGRILFRHILPNLAPTLTIQLALQASALTLAESALTFIGIGAQPGASSWGLMLSDAQIELSRSPPIWWVFASASLLGILPAALAWNLLGEALRSALDPERAPTLRD